MHDSQQDQFQKARDDQPEGMDTEKVWSFDGHGINCNGQRMFTIPQTVKEDPEAKVMAEAVGKALAEYANTAHRLNVRMFGKNHVPQIFLDLTTEELEAEAIPASVIVVTVKRPDGKEARFHHTVGATTNTHQGRLRCSAGVLSMGKEQGDETDKTVAAKFADWS